MKEMLYGQELLSFFYSEANERYEKECQKKIADEPITDQIIDFYTWYVTYVESFGVEFVTNFFNNTNPAMNTHIYNNPIIMITDDLLWMPFKGATRCVKGIL